MAEESSPIWMFAVDETVGSSSEVVVILHMARALGRLTEVFVVTGDLQPLLKGTLFFLKYERRRLKYPALMIVCSS